jgi:hypothetical protein
VGEGRSNSFGVFPFLDVQNGPARGGSHVHAGATGHPPPRPPPPPSPKGCPSPIRTRYRPRSCQSTRTQATTIAPTHRPIPTHISTSVRHPLHSLTQSAPRRVSYLAAGLCAIFPQSKRQSAHRPLPSSFPLSHTPSLPPSLSHHRTQAPRT